MTNTIDTSLTDEEARTLGEAQRKQRIRVQLARVARKITALESQLDEARKRQAELSAEFANGPRVDAPAEPVVLAPDDTEGDSTDDDGE